MKLIFKEGKKYGNTWYYPQNDAAKSIVSIAKRLTLDINQLRTLENEGKFECEVLPPDTEYSETKTKNENN